MRTRPLTGAMAGILLACSVGVGIPAAGQVAAVDTAEPVHPTQVEAIMRSMSDLLGSSKGLSLRAQVIHDDALDSGVLVQRSATLELVIDRPAGIHAVLTEGAEQRKLWSDGKTATLFDVSSKIYSRTKVPGKIGPTLDFLMEKYGLSLPLADFLFEKPYEALMGHVGRAYYIGLVEVDGAMCHQLAFTQDSIDWQLWVEAGVRPVPRRLLIVYKRLPGSPRYLATVSDLELRSAPFPGSFVPILPDDADELELLEVVTIVTPK
jgi:hypothetical protein